MLPGIAPMPPRIQTLAYSVLTDAQKHRFEEISNSTSHRFKGMSRFRANLFNQKGAVGAVFRAIPYEIKTFEASPAARRFGYVQKPRGLILVTGPTGRVNRRRLPRWSIR